MNVKLLLLLPILSSLAEDDLKRWHNDEVEAIRTAAPENGKSLVIAAKHRTEYKRTECMIFFPVDAQEHQYSFIVFEGNVFDENNEVVEGIEVWNDGDENTCGIRKLKTDDHGEGEGDIWATGFTIVMKFLDGGLFGQTKLSQPVKQSQGEGIK